MTRKLPNYDPAEHMLRLEDALLTRRQLLQKTGMGMGALSLAMMLSNELYSSTAMAATATNPLLPKAAPLAAKAKHVIHIFAGGGPSHVDTWDYKPALAKYADQQLPGLGGLSYPTPYKFRRWANRALKSARCSRNWARWLMRCASSSRCLPMCRIMGSPRGFCIPVRCKSPSRVLDRGWCMGWAPRIRICRDSSSLGGNAEFRQASFLPSLFQGVEVNYSKGMPLNKILLNIHSQFTTTDEQRMQLILARELDKIHAEKLHKEDALETRIESFEMAFKMQTEATDAFDISKEPKEMTAMYGDTNLGAKLMVARRLVERGVRFIQVDAGGWDHHSNLEKGLRDRATDIDKPAAGLLKDLKQRGLLKDTLVIWGGEFGRTVTVDAREATPGRNHNGKAMCAWMAGGGVKAGFSYGETDEFGARAAVDRVAIHDFHATILRLLGFDHTKLTYRYNGRDFRLTDNFGDVVTKVIA